MTSTLSNRASKDDFTTGQQYDSNKPGPQTLFLWRLFFRSRCVSVDALTPKGFIDHDVSSVVEALLQAGS
jgi:hypothetical protein